MGTLWNRLFLDVGFSVACHILRVFFINLIGKFFKIKALDKILL